MFYFFRLNKNIQKKPFPVLTNVDVNQRHLVIKYRLEMKITIHTHTHTQIIEMRYICILLAKCVQK